MSKRRATTDLNSDNWDRDDEPEVAGNFQKASEQVVQSRVIRSAKRRLQPTNATSGSGSTSEPKKLGGLFQAFTGFDKMKPSADPSSVLQMTKNSFNFLKKSDTPLKTNSDESKNKNDNLSPSETNEKYLAKLKGLNEGVLDWIKQHVESNPCCILTPVFRDYDKYLKEIESEKDSSLSTSSSKTNSMEFSFSSDTSKTTKPLSSDSSSKLSLGASPIFPLGGSKTTDKITSPLSSNTEINLKKPSPFESKDTEKKSSSPSFVFDSSKSPLGTSIFGISKTDKDTAKPGDSLEPPEKKKSFFAFGSSTDKPAFDIKFPSVPPGGNFTFGGINNAPESSGNNDVEDEDEPKPEPVKPVTEDDAIYTQRVKVFVKKGENYSDLGVGNLFIKEAPNGWHQAIVRNDTSLGNIIFNILLSSQHPTKRLGKNNVMIVCLPTPQHKGPAVPVLLRVKTPEDADKLLQTLDKYKKK